MSIMTANFKHLCQCRRLWLWYFFILGFGYSQIHIARNSKEMGFLHFMLILLAFYFAGSLIGSLAADVLSKPFTYTLPGHRRMPRVIVVTASLVASLAIFLIALWLEPSKPSHRHHTPELKRMSYAFAWTPDSTHASVPVPDRLGLKREIFLPEKILSA